MLLGAIDLGSNAIRFMVASAQNFENEWRFQRVEYLRYPLRLGEDVFLNKPVSALKIEKLIKICNAFKAMFEVFEVKSYQAYATSAMRDAINGQEIVTMVREKTGIEIQIIDGQQEANLIDKAIVKFLDNKDYIHIDVGGGSTEINFIKKNKKTIAKSFNIGTVRAIQQTILPQSWEEMQIWVAKESPEFKDKLSAIGTGGNIKKLQELISNIAEQPISLSELIALRNKLDQMTIAQRMYNLGLNQDRADVIVHAADIFIRIMQWSGAPTIIAPNIGLVDGIVIDIFEKMEPVKLY